MESRGGSRAAPTLHRFVYLCLCGSIVRVQHTAVLNAYVFTIITMKEVPHHEPPSEYFQPRIRVAAWIILCCLVGLAARLWYLQIVKGGSYEEMARDNRVRLIRLSPSRGRIMDCHGRILAENRPGFTFAVVPGELKDPISLIDYFSTTLGITPEEMITLIEKSRSTPKFRAYPLKKNMTLEQVSLIKSNPENVDGVSVEVRPVRVYPQKETLCHVIGIMGEISAEELITHASLGYRAGDLTGKTGIEKQYEPYLKGVEGWERIEIDAKGRQLRVLEKKPPVMGTDIYLTVDASLQGFVEEIFKDRAGSVVAVDPETGRILAMVSKPGFDLNLFSPSISRRDWNVLNNDPLHPLENRSIRGVYSPASAFKLVVAAAALAEGVVTPGEKITCKGEMELGGQVFRCWNRHGHGKTELNRAMVESCDIYFYELGLRLGSERIAHYASLFGLGKPTGCGLPQELPGLIPTSRWKLRTYGEKWKDGETLLIAIGQGYLACTPIQMAMMTAAIANGGRLMRPAIVQEIKSADGRTVFAHVPVVRRKLPLDAASLKILREAMAGVVSSQRGTGRRCRIPGVAVAGKTGTSQVVRLYARMQGNELVPYHERTHAIFVGYVDDMPKKLALAVVVEHGGQGGESAAPVARRIICRYYGIPDPVQQEDTMNALD